MEYFIMIPTFPTVKLPNLIEVQIFSFCWFLTKGLPEEIKNYSSMINEKHRLELIIYDQEYKLKCPPYTELVTRQLKVSYNIKIYVFIQVSKIIAEQPLQKENIGSTQKVFIGEFPLMTNKGTFIFNGCERIIINQLVRSPGVYFKKMETRLKGDRKKIKYESTIITNRGSWLTFELENDLVWFKLDKKFKIPIYGFLLAFDINDDEIYGTMNNYNFFKNSLEPLNYMAAVGNFDYENFYNTVERVEELIELRILNSQYYDLGEVGRLKINKKLEVDLPLYIRTLTPLDVLKVIDYLIDISFHQRKIDDIDSLENRRVRSVGELFQIQIRTGLNRLKINFLNKNDILSEKKLSKKANLVEKNSFDIKPNHLINSKIVTSVIKEFFGLSPLSQYFDETNALAELTHKRRISSLGPGALSGDHVSFAARDIHPTQYGRLCPIETPEGQKAGLISSLATYAKINKYGFIKTPFFQVKKGEVLKHLPIVYLTAENESQYKIVSADIKVSKKNTFFNDFVPVRYKENFIVVHSHEVNLMAISPIQVISVAASLIPFLEHDDANRALMGSNMQRQAVPLLYPQKPIIGTGIESRIAADSLVVMINLLDGIVNYVSADQIRISSSEISSTPKCYFLDKYRRSNQETAINQKPIVWIGEFIKSGQIIADGPGTDGGELALGQNLIVAYMPWEGYNYEDAILVSDRLIQQDLFTSIHIQKYETDLRETDSGVEEMTKQIPNGGEYFLRNLDDNGLISVGAFVEAGDILVGKITPKAESEQFPEGKFLKAVFNIKTPDVKDTSLRVPNGVSGRVIDIKIISKEQNNNLPPGVFVSISIFIAQIRKIKVGDKIAGRHGNKGVISKIIPIQDMPYLLDGTIVDIILNPLGVPSRMNVGQIFECLLGIAGDYLNQRFKLLPFDEMYSAEASRVLINKKLKQAAIETNRAWLFNSNHPGKVILTDGRTGELFDNPILIGKAYILKLIHMIDNKIHARSTGPYSLVTQQPLGGKAHQGGQRFGEMEVWALEAFGVAYTLRELLTLKSDDIEGRNEVLTAIVKGHSIPNPGIPESFKVLLCELQALGLDITLHQIKKSEKVGLLGVDVDLTSNIEIKTS
uniref:DNA-directed RNA polymerase subunit beta n=1 Tax=Schizocladia ischiensis TaxID=196139 RepID=A0A7S6U9W8_9STRA|nr:RNA polymerase beta subunit [Schizocladia ischiensis]QOW07522.1 RNA polymerase beta subunit [Schizocladia ischiensis]